MNSFGHRSNSAKMIGYTKKEIDSYLSKNLKNFKNSQKRNNLKHNISYKTSDNFYPRNNSIKNIYNKLSTTSLSKKNEKYGNFFIFGKRELAFNKSMREGRKVFKYHQSTIDEEDEKINKKRKISSLYITESLFKRNKTTLPLIDKDKSIVDEYDISFLNINKNDQKTRNKKDVIYLRNISLNKEREKKTKERKEFLVSQKLIRKNDILVKYNIKENSLVNYVQNMRDYLTDKYTLDIKNEKYKVINENNKNKLEIINDKVRDLTSNFKLYNEIFLPKYNEYIKRVIKQRDLEKKKDNIYLNKIYTLQRSILTIKNKINKCQNEKDNIIREMLLQISIKEKKLHLPEYYYDILVNNIPYNELKEKYNINKKEFDRVLEYKTNLDDGEEEIIEEKLRRLENDNIESMFNYNKERDNILTLNKQKIQVEYEIKNDTIINNIENVISIKEKILENIIKKYKKLSQDKSFLLKTLNKKKNKHTKLYHKIKLLFENLNNYIKYNFYEKKKEKIKGEITEEMLIIEIIKKLERIIAIFLEKNRQLTKNNSEQIKNYKNMIEKKKKILKTTEIRKNIDMELEKQRKKVFEKYNKIIYLQRRKIPIFNISEKKLNIKKSKSQQGINSEQIDDYLYDLNSED